MKTLTIKLSPLAPPAVPDGWAAVKVEAYRVNPYGCSDYWGVGDRKRDRFGREPRTLEIAIAMAFEHVLFAIGLENAGVDIVLERGDDEARITYSGRQDKWQVELPDSE